MARTSARDRITIRRIADGGTADERAAIVRLGTAALGWDPRTPNAELFAWKHLENPFGTSPMWVAEADGEVVGFRTFLRWEFTHPDGTTVPAVRAVDTATHPDHQGQGVFTRLTLGALDDLAAEPIEFVFNTPNDQSRPGYLKMGWQVVGRVPVRIRARSLRALARAVRARVPAAKWSEPTTAGEAAAEALADQDAVATALGAAESADGIATRRNPTFMRWRYGSGPVGYRVARLGADLVEGFAVFRVRSRGAATETVLCDLVAPDRHASRALVRGVARATGSDYLLEGRRSPGSVPLPRQGPILTWRHVVAGAPPPMRSWSLSLGDVELF